MSNPKLLKKTSASVLSALLAAVPAMGGVAAVATTVQAADNDEGEAALKQTDDDNASLKEDSEGTGEPNDGSTPTETETTDTDSPEDNADDATEEQVDTEDDGTEDETSAAVALSKDADGRYHINLFNLDFDSRIALSTNFRIFKDGNNNGKFDGESVDPTVGTPLESSTKNEYQMQGLTDGTYFVKVEGINTPGYTVPTGIATVHTSDMISDAVAGETANPTGDNPTNDDSDSSEDKAQDTDDTNKTDEPTDSSDDSKDSGSKSSTGGPLSNLADLLNPNKLLGNLPKFDLGNLSDSLTNSLKQGMDFFKQMFESLGVAAKDVTSALGSAVSNVLSFLGNDNVSKGLQDANTKICELMGIPIAAFTKGTNPGASIAALGNNVIQMFTSFSKSLGDVLGSLGKSSSADNATGLLNALSGNSSSDTSTTNTKAETPSSTPATDKSGTDTSVGANESTDDAATDAADSMSQSDINKIDDALKNIGTQVLKASKEDDVQKADQEDKLTHDLSDTQNSAKILSEEGLAGVSKLQQSDSLLDSITDGISKLTGGNNDSSKESDSSSNSAGSGLLGNLFGGSLFKGTSLLGNLIGSQLRVLANVYGTLMYMLGMDKNKSFIYSTLMKLSNKLTGRDDGSDTKSEDNPNENGKDSTGKDTESTEDSDSQTDDPITPSNDAEINKKLSDNTKIDTTPYSPKGDLTSDAPVVTKGSVTFYSHKNGSGANGANAAVNTGSFPIVPVAISAGASSLALGAYMVLKKKKISE